MVHINVPNNKYFRALKCSEPIIFKHLNRISTQARYAIYTNMGLIFTIFFTILELSFHFSPFHISTNIELSLHILRFRVDI